MSTQSDNSQNPLQCRFDDFAQNYVDGNNEEIIGNTVKNHLSDEIPGKNDFHDQIGVSNGERTLHTLQFYYTLPITQRKGLTWYSPYVVICPPPDATPHVEDAVALADEIVSRFKPGGVFYPEKDPASEE